MASALVTELPTGGFSFANCIRNVNLDAAGLKAPRAVKTGTTIVGAIFANGVVLGADTRATSGNIVADKNCFKIHRLAPRIHCCGAGTAADTEMTCRNIESQLELLRLNTGREVPVVVANRLLKQTLFRYQGHVEAALVLGGVDKNGPHIYSIYPHGSTDVLPYTTMGSGSLAAIAVLESNWRADLNEDEAVDLIKDSIKAGITNDLGSGSNVDIMIIRSTDPEGKHVTLRRPFEEVGIRGQRQGRYLYPKGTTKVLDTKVIPIVVEEEEVLPVEGMDVDNEI